MKKILLGTFLGVVLIFSGIISFYIYLDGLKNTNNLLLLILFIVLFFPGVYILYRSGSINAYGLDIDQTKPVTDTKNKESLIEKNSRLGTEWEKTTDQRDKLKILSLSGQVQEK